jgi:hypothetical protein
MATGKFGIRATRGIVNFEALNRVDSCASPRRPPRSDGGSQEKKRSIK